MRIKSEKRISSGKYVDLANITVDDIDIEDITCSLNNQVRFTGHYKNVRPLTVAQHTYLCAIIAEMLYPGDDMIYRAVVMHDFPEYLYGDIISPIKELIGRDVMKKITAPIDDAVNKKFWPYVDVDINSDAIHYAVKTCDYLSLDIERRVMWKSQLGKDKWPEAQDVGLSLSSKQQLFNEVKDVYVDLQALLDGNFKPTRNQIGGDADANQLNLFVG